MIHHNPSQNQPEFLTRRSIIPCIHTTYVRAVAQVDRTEGRILIDPLEFHVGAIAIEGADGSEQHAVTTEGPCFDLPRIDLAAAGSEDREPACDAATGFPCRLSRMRRGGRRPGA